MKLIQNNPYRIIGLLAGATTREQQRQIKRLKQFIDAEQTPEDDFSFPSIGKLDRTLENITEASSKLNLDGDKMNAAIFWFCNGNEVTDEPAFDALKVADTQKCQNIWSKMTGAGEVTHKNYSAFQNLSTLLLSYAFRNSDVNINLLDQAISIKLKFLESDFIKDFKSLVTDETYKVTKEELQLMFLNQLQAEIDFMVNFPPQKFVEIVINQQFSAKEDFLNEFIQKIIEVIDKKIDESRIKRKANKDDALCYGRALYNVSSYNLHILKSIIDVSNLKFTSISDKVSEEILVCGLDYFSFFRDSNTDPGSLSMELFQFAKSFAISNVLKQQCQEHIESMQLWIKDKPQREKQRLIQDDLRIIDTKLEKFQNLYDTTDNAKDLIETCKPCLVRIKKRIGSSDEFYLKVSSAVISNAQGMLVNIVNSAQEKYNRPPTKTTNISVPRGNSPFNTADYLFSGNNTFDSNPIVKLTLLHGTVKEVYEIFISMQTMDMSYKIREQFNKNKETLSNIKYKTNPFPERNKSNCYIATMAYGNYDHPQVIILRQFRDNILQNSHFGRFFIKFYYKYSPRLVEMLKDKKRINWFIRKLLNQFIKLIEK